jgi:hypothetical protein
VQKSSQYINEEGFSEFKLECGCISTNISGFGWSTDWCEEHEPQDEPEFESLKFKPKREY